MRTNFLKRFRTPLLLSLAAHAVLLTGWKELGSQGAWNAALRGTLEPRHAQDSILAEAASATAPVGQRPESRVAGTNIRRQHLQRSNARAVPGPIAAPGEEVTSDISAAAEMAVPALGNESLVQYRLALAREAGKVWQYPSEAREHRWEGLVVVSVDFAIPRAPRVAIEASSGVAALDRQAEKIVRQAVGGATVPEAVRQGRAKVAVPIQFALDD